MLYALGSDRPELRGDNFVADNATLIGKVVLELGASVWFGAVLRGDNERISVGAGSNIQECAVLHTDPGFTLTVGPDCTIGHAVVLHGCTVGEGSLIGIKSVIMNGAVIGRHCLIGANTLVSEGKSIPERSLVIGSPGRVVRELNDDEVARIQWSARNYAERARRYRSELRAAT